MTAVHACPTIPPIDVDFPPAGPLRCLECGQVLKITCGNEGCPPPLGPRNQVAQGSIAARVYKPKTCLGCQDEFLPTGPRDTLCADCKAKR